jgi:hypothetical protein
MASAQLCDICGQPAAIVRKLFLASKAGRNDHSNYTHHADVGECCLPVVDDIHWQKRVRRSNGRSANAVGASAPDQTGAAQ